MEQAENSHQNAFGIKNGSMRHIIPDVWVNKAHSEQKGYSPRQNTT